MFFMILRLVENVLYDDAAAGWKCSIWLCRVVVSPAQFMQRGLDAETKKQLEEDEKRIISDEHWYLDLPELKAKEWVLDHTRPEREKPVKAPCLNKLRPSFW